MKFDRQLSDILTDRNYFQFVNQPTRFDNYLDLVISDLNFLQSNLLTNFSVTDIAFSDHKLVKFEIFFNFVNAKTESFTFRNLKGIDPSEFSELLQKSSIYSECPADPDSFVTKLYSDVNVILDKLAPLTTITKRCTLITRPTPPWYTSELIKAKRKTRQLERKHNRTKSVTDFAAWKKARRHNTKLIKIARNNFLKNAISEASGAKHSWKIINNILCKPKNNPTNITGVTAESLCKYFVDKITKIQASIFGILSAVTAVKIESHSCETALKTFLPVTVSETKTVINSLQKPSPVDLIPLRILKASSSVFAVLICRLANLTFETGVFPSQFKIAEVKPLLKKPDLDPTDHASYRPISNLNSIGKILEKLVHARISAHLLNSPNFSALQSGYRPFHSTETANLKILNDLIFNSSKGSPSMLISLDLSSAFDCVIHTKLLDRLHDDFGIDGICLKWLKSYLHNRSQYVSLMNARSPTILLQTGVPQGSVLAPLLFSSYVSPISRLASQHNLSCHSYADDTTIYFPLGCNTDIETKLNALNICTTDLKNWLMFQGLMLNPNKTDAIVTGTKQQVHRTDTQTSSIKIADVDIEPSDSLKLLGVTYDSNLTFNAHINNLCKSVNIQLRSLKHIRKYLDQPTANIVATSIVASRLDYCNALLPGITQYNMKRLQNLQTHAAKIVTKNYQKHQCNLLKELHWLPVRHRIEYKISLITFKALNTNNPKYLKELLNPYIPQKSLRSSSQFLLQVPTSKSALHDRAYAVVGPTTFNSLPIHLRQFAFDSESNINSALTGTFKKQLKTHLFSKYLSS